MNEGEWILDDCWNKTTLAPRMPGFQTFSRGRAKNPTVNNCSRRHNCYTRHESTMCLTSMYELHLLVNPLLWHCFSQMGLWLLDCRSRRVQDQEHLEKFWLAPQSRDAKSELWAGAENHRWNKHVWRQCTLHLDHLSVAVSCAAENSASRCMRYTLKPDYKSMHVYWYLPSADNLSVSAKSWMAR